MFIKQPVRCGIIFNFLNRYLNHICVLLVLLPKTFIDKVSNAYFTIPYFKAVTFHFIKNVSAIMLKYQQKHGISTNT